MSATRRQLEPNSCTMQHRRVSSPALHARPVSGSSTPLEPCLCTPNQLTSSNPVTNNILFFIRPFLAAIQTARDLNNHTGSL